MRSWKSVCLAIGLQVAWGCVGEQALIQPPQEDGAYSEGVFSPDLQGTPSHVIQEEGKGIPYMIRLSDKSKRTGAFAQSLVEPVGGEVEYVFKHVYDGFRVRLPNAEAAKGIQRNPHVEYVLPDTGTGRDDAIQYNPHWGLDRIDQWALPLNSQYRYFEYGQGVHVFIVDSGLDSDHPELASNISQTYVYSNRSPYDPFNDCHPHGTQVASMVAGETLGVAKNAILHAMQVTDCSGNSDGQGGPAMAIDMAVNFTLNHGQWPAVINYSRSHEPWIWPFSNPIEDAVRGAVDAGIPVVVSAGNDGGNACNWTPGRLGKAITVGATTVGDAVYSGSNSGSCVDLFAPGFDLPVAMPGGGIQGGYWGTSFSAPLVTGTLALILGDPAVYPPTARFRLMEGATTGVLSDLRNGPDILLHSLYTQVSLQGPDEVDEVGWETWTANAWGGTKIYEFQWLIRPDGQAEWEYLIGETSAALSMEISENDPSFGLRVFVTSGGDQVRDEMYVTNLICSEGGGGGECEW